MQLKKISVLAIVMPGITIPKQSITSPPEIIRQSPDAAPDLSTLSGLAEAQHIPLIRSLNFADQALIHQLSDLNADLFLLACFPLKLSEKLWRMPDTACWNLHPSLLPAYRGPNPIHWQLENNERNTGVTLHEVTETIDAGNIIAQKPASLPADTSASSLNNWIAEHGTDIFIRAFQQHQSGNLKPRQQEEAQASYFPNAN